MNMHGQAAESRGFTTLSTTGNCGQLESSLSCLAYSAVVDYPPCILRHDALLAVRVSQWWNFYQKVEAYVYTACRE